MTRRRLLVAGAAAALALAVALPLLLTGGGGPERLYADSSPLNTPIPDGAEADPRSPAMVAQLEREAERQGFLVSAGRFTSPIAEADASTPRHDVVLRHEPYAGAVFVGAPIPEGARPSPDSDGGLIVLDRSTGCEFDYGGLRLEADGRWSAHFANALPLDGSGIYPSGESPSASGFASAAGKIRPQELARGEIPHALTFGMEATKAGGPVPPARASDGRSTLPGAIPEGARVQLDPQLDLGALDLEPWQRTVARALQRYGMFLVDSGGSLAVSAEHVLSAGPDAYPWGAEVYARLPSALVPHLRVLRLPPQRPSDYRFVETRCARIRR